MIYCKSILVYAAESESNKANVGEKLSRRLWDGMKTVSGVDGNRTDLSTSGGVRQLIGIDSYVHCRKTKYKPRIWNVLSGPSGQGVCQWCGAGKWGLARSLTSDRTHAKWNEDHFKREWNVKRELCWNMDKLKSGSSGMPFFPPQVQTAMKKL